MRLFLDGRKLGDGGIGTFIKSLVEGLIHSNDILRTNHSLHIVVGYNSKKKTDLPTSWLKKNYINIEFDKTKKYSFREYFLFPIKWKKKIDKCDLYVSPHYTLPFFLKTKTLVVIHDVIQQQYPETFLHRIIPKILIQSAINRADNLASVSQNSVAKIQSKFIINKKVHVIPNSVRASLARNSGSSKVNSKVKTVLFVGSDRLHKQLNLFLDFVALASQKDININAVVVSSLRSQSQIKIKELGLENKVRVQSSIDDRELLEVYLNCDALIVTSIEEGFCLPILEAMHLGISVIAPDLAYSHELLADSGNYYQEGSVADLLRCWVELSINLESRVNKISTGVLISSKYTPINQFQKLINIYGQNNTENIN